MDLRFTEAEERFRQEVRDFLKAELPPEKQLGGGFEQDGLEERWPVAREFEKKLAAKGWLTMAWPKEYGGQGRSAVEQLIFTEEISYARAPGIGGMAVAFIGPTIAIYGNEEQKKEYLGRIARGEIHFCQGFSEPNVGSDLASLETRAVGDGDYYIINGEKIWTSAGHHADYCWLGARTDFNAPRHKSISAFIVPMNTPGITVLPIINIVGGHGFNQTVFEDVRIHKSYMVGEKNSGWYQLATTLDFERSGVRLYALAKRNLEELVEYAKETVRNGECLWDNGVIRNKLAALAVEIEVGRMMAYRVAWMRDASLVPSVEASMCKLLASELSQRVVQVASEVLGMYFTLEENSRWAPMAGRFTPAYFGAFAETLASGTSEIQRNVIAMRGLGLPR